MGKMIKALSGNGKVICYCLDSTDMCARAEQIHRTSATVTAAIGRLLTAASMMGAMLPEEDNSVTLRLKGDGDIGSVIAVAEGTGNSRAYVENPIVELPLNQYGKLDVAGAVGRQGVLYVMKDLGMDEPVIGNTPIVSGEIAEDITHYFVLSEQIPTVCALGVLVNTDLTVLSAGGFIAQLLPGAEEGDIGRLEKAIGGLPAVTKMIQDGMTAQDIAFKVLEGCEPKILEERTVEYRCDCSRSRVERALISLGRQELEKMEREEKVVEADCHFCNKKYRFNSEEIQTLLHSVTK